MKKWIGVFIAVSALVLLVVRSVVGEDLAKHSEFGKIQEENGYISQIAKCDDEDYVIYKNTELGNIQIEKIKSQGYDFETVGTVHYNDRIYYVYRFMYEMEQNFGIAPVTMEKGEVWEDPLFVAEGSFLTAGCTEDEIFVTIINDENNMVTEFVLPMYDEYGEWEEWESYWLADDHYVVAGAYEEGELYLVQEDGVVFTCDVEIYEAGVELEDTALTTRFQQGIISGAKGLWERTCNNRAAVKCILPILVISICVVFGFYGARVENHLIYRLICCTEIICVAALLILSEVFTEGLVQKEILNSGVETGYILEELKMQQNADATIDVQSYLSILEKRGDYLEDLMVVEPENGEVLLARTLPAGVKVADYYGQACLELIGQVAEDTQSAMISLEETGSNCYVVASRDFTQISAQSVLLAVISKNGVEGRIGEVIALTRSVSYFIMLIATAVHMLVFLFFSSRWKNFLEGMEYVASRKSAYAEVPKRNDGLYGAWAILDRIGHNVVMLKRDRDLLYKSYYRFVPKGMERLLNKPEVAEIEPGDCNKVKGCMVTFHMENIKDKSHDTYMDIMKESMELTRKCREKNHGIMISNSADLQQRKIFFEQAPYEALNFAADVYQAHTRREKMADTDVIMMLHQAEYYYGMTGTEEMMIPFMYCEEEKVLDTYMGALAKAKVKIVLTEQTLKAIGNGLAVRYIGFVAGDALKGSIKLYEGLDAYSQDRIKKIKESDVLFQKALSRFYSNDFYVARNLFNEVLKMNGQDEIAKWYLFHCEFYLNRPEAEITYGLFENVMQKSNYDVM